LLPLALRCQPDQPPGSAPTSVKLVIAVLAEEHAGVGDDRPPLN
jgi:hypothetical protein